MPPTAALPEVRADASSVTHPARGRTKIIYLAVALFSLGNSADLFLLLRAQNLGLSASLAPALGLLFNLVYTVLSWPAGRISDRMPRRSLIVVGYIVYNAVYFGFAFLRTPRAVWLLFALYGVYYALTEGVLRAWIADLVPSASRASAFGVLNWLLGVAALPASLLAGWLWQHYSPAAPFYLSALLSALAAVLLLFA